MLAVCVCVCLHVSRTPGVTYACHSIVAIDLRSLSAIAVVRYVNGDVARAVKADS